MVDEYEAEASVIVTTSTGNGDAVKVDVDATVTVEKASDVKGAEQSAQDSVRNCLMRKSKGNCMGNRNQQRFQAPCWALQNGTP